MLMHARVVCIIILLLVSLFLILWLVIWDCYPMIMMTIQNNAIDYIGGFFTVLDGYMNIE